MSHSTLNFARQKFLLWRNQRDWWHWSNLKIMIDFLISIAFSMYIMNMNHWVWVKERNLNKNLKEIRTKILSFSIAKSICFCSYSLRLLILCDFCIVTLVLNVALSGNYMQRQCNVNLKFNQIQVDEKIKICLRLFLGEQMNHTVCT